MSINFEDLNPEGKKLVIRLVKGKEIIPNGISLMEYFKDYLVIFKCPLCGSDKAIKLRCSEVGCKGCFDTHFKCSNCEKDIK